MALDVALVLRLVDRLSGPLKKPMAATVGLGRMAEAASRDIAGIGTTARRTIESIGSQQADIAHFRKLKVQVGQTEAELRKARGRAADLARQLKLTQAETKVDPKEIKRLTRELDGANRAAKRLKTTHTEQSIVLDGLRRGLGEAGIKTRDLASESRRLTQETEAQSRAMERQSRIQERMTQHRGRLASINDRMERTASRRANLRGSAMEAGAIGYGLMRLIGGAGEAQSMLVDVGITADVPKERLEELRKTVNTVAYDTFQDRIAVLGAQQKLVAFGLDFDTSEKSLPAIARTAYAEKAEVGDIAAAGFAAINNLDLPVDQLEKGFDIMAMGAQSGGFELRAMAQYLPKLTGRARKLGLLGEEGLATLVAASQVSFDTTQDESSAANNLQNFLIQMTSDQTIQNFDKAGVDLVAEMQEAAENGENRFERILELIQETTDGESHRIQEIFRDQQVTGFLDAILPNIEKYQRIKAEALGGDGKVDRDFERRETEDPTGEWARFSESFKDFRNKIALPLLPVITEMMQTVGPMVERFGAWAAANPELIAQIGWILGGLLLMKVAFVALGFAVTTLITPFLWLGKALVFSRMGLAWLGIESLGLSAAFKGLGLRLGSIVGRVAGFGWALGKGLVADIGKVVALLTRFGRPILRGIVGGGLGFVKLGLRGLAAAMLANPVGLVIAGLAATAYILWDNWENVTGWFEAKTGRVKDAFGNGFLNGMVQLVHEFNPFRLLWDTLDGLVDYLFGVDLKSWFSGLTDSISEMTGGLLELIGVRDAEDERSARIAAAAEKQTQIAFEQSDKGKTAKAAVEEYQALDARGLVPQSDLKVVPDYQSGLAQRAGVLPTVAGMRAALGIDGQRATGGPVWSGGSFLVGERGPEIITTGRSGFVLPAAATAALMAAPLAASPALTLDTRPALVGTAPSAATAATGPGNVTIEVGDIIINAERGQDEREIAEQVRLELEKLIRAARRTDADLHNGSELFLE